MIDSLVVLLVACAVTAVGCALFWTKRGFFWRPQRVRPITAKADSESPQGSSRRGFIVAGGAV